MGCFVQGVKSMCDVLSRVNTDEKELSDLVLNFCPCLSF